MSCNFLIIDIALIRLPLLPFNTSPGKNIDIIAFSTKTNKELVGKDFLASGWGFSEEHPDVVHRDLRIVGLEFYDGPRISIDGHEANPKRILIAAQKEGKSICYGDSGGSIIFINIISYSVWYFV